MCLELEIELPLEVSTGYISARRLSTETGLRVSGYHTPSGSRRFHFARGKECSCSLLGDDFKIDAREWPLTPDAAEALAKAVALLAATVPAFSLRSVWCGSEHDPVRVSVGVDQLLEELRSNYLLAHAIRAVSKTA
jgi:hypothetical protein